MSAKILVVEDDHDIRRLLELQLGGAGYATVFARDAIGAVSQARKEEPDAIILDLGLPGGDGFVVMERLQAFPALEGTPIVVVTARGEELRERALGGGAVAFFTKPWDSAELLDALERELGAAN